MGIKRPVAIIPFSYSPPVQVKKCIANHPRRVLFLGRIHPIKGLESLIEAWRRIQQRFLDWELHIVGPGDEKYLRQISDGIRSLQCQRVVLREGVYGLAKFEEYAAADLFILPSLSENFAMTVPECLAQGTPVIATKGTPWSGLVENRCGWWTERTQESLAHTLTEAMTLPPLALATMGERGKKWIAAEFSLGRLSNEMVEVYRWVTYGGEIPATVRTE